MKSMTLSLDRANASHLITNALIGVSAHLHEASNAPESIKESFILKSLGFADHVSAIVDRVFDGFGFTEDKDGEIWTFEKEHYILDMDGAEFLMLLTAVRSTFEMYMYAKSRMRHEIVCPINDTNFPKEFMAIGNNPIECARASHCLLDFLESHCDDSLLLKWRDLRKETSREMLTTLTDRWVSVEDDV
jgi:hypothetical protein